MVKLDAALAAKLARLGAWQRMNEIESEARQLRAAFPDLFNGATSNGAAAPTNTREAEPATPTPKRRMSPAARRKIGKRMKAYWRQWRVEHAKDAR